MTTETATKLADAKIKLRESKWHLIASQKEGHAVNIATAKQNILQAYMVSAHRNARASRCVSGFRDRAIDGRSQCATRSARCTPLRWAVCATEARTA